MNLPHNLEATVFVYRLKTGEIVCRYTEGPHPQDAQHLDTLEPRLWIQTHYDDVMAEGKEEK